MTKIDNFHFNIYIKKLKETLLLITKIIYILYVIKFLFFLEMEHCGHQYFYKT